MSQRLYGKALDNLTADYLQNDLNRYNNEAFDALINFQIQNVVANYGSTSTLLGKNKYALTIDNVRVQNLEPTLSQCYEYKLSQLAVVVGDITFSYVPLEAEDDAVPTVISKVRSVIGPLPLPTGKTSLSHRAYADADQATMDVQTSIYVLNGKQRSIPAIKSPMHNTSLLYKKKKMFTVEIRCTHTSKIFRSTSTIKFCTERHPKRATNVGLISCKLPYRKKGLPVAVIAMALGCSSERFIELIRLVAGHTYEVAIFRQYEIHILQEGKVTQEDALRRISAHYGKNILSTGQNIMLNEVFPHVKRDPQQTDEEHATLKLMFLVKQVVLVIRFAHGKIQNTNRDGLTFSKLKNSAFMLGDLFRLLLQAHVQKNGKMMRRSLTTHEKRLLEHLEKVNTKRRNIESLLRAKKTKVPSLAEVVDEMDLEQDLADVQEHVGHEIMQDVLQDNLLSFLPCQKRKYPKAEQERPSKKRKTKARQEVDPVPNIDEKEAALSSKDNELQLERYTIAEAAKHVGHIDLVKLFSVNRLTTKIISAASSGVWSADRKGVTILLDDNNRDSRIGQLRRVSSSLNQTDGAHTEPRDVYGDQYGYICSSSTPSGDKTGLVYELALTATITTPHPDPLAVARTITFVLRPLLVDVLHAAPEATFEPGDYHYIDITGTYTHNIRVKDVDPFVRAIRRGRRGGTFPRHLFIAVDHERQVVRTMLEGGLPARPLVVFENRHLLRDDMTFDEALSLGVVEFVTPREEQTLCLIGVTFEDVQYALPHQTVTHIELYQAAFVGIIAANVYKFPGIQAPRIAYFTGQLKQIMTAHRDQQSRGNIGSTHLWHAHRSLVTTRVAEIMEMNECRGTPCTLAYLALPGNQEDAIVINEASVQRGLMAASTQRRYVSDCDHTKNGGALEQFQKMDVVLSKKTANYDHVEKNGRPLQHTVVKGGSVVIAKTRQVEQHIAGHPRGHAEAKTPKVLLKERDISTVCKDNEGGVVVTSKTMSIPTGLRTIVEINTMCPPQEGDKFTTVHVQKGTAVLVPPENLPFTVRDGIQADLYVSPASQISRMTVSSLDENLTGKAVALSGDLSLGLDDQDFSRSYAEDRKRVREILLEAGFKSDGTERMMDGITGKMIEADIYIGVTTYFRLVHLASKKIHARTWGPRDIMTRQPKDRRRLDGGLRYGEMEVSGILGHGAAYMLQRRTREYSDGHVVYICSECYDLCEACEDVNFFFCNTCETRDHIVQITLPFGLLLLKADLEAIGVSLKLRVKPNQEIEIEQVDPLDYDIFL